MFWKQRSVRGTADYWRRRRRKVIEELRANGFIARVGPAGQIVDQRFVGQKEAQRWWRQAERPPRFWLLTLLLSGALVVVIQKLPPVERKPYLAVLVAPPLLHASVGFLRHLRR